jgi:hypothetical protein
MSTAASTIGANDVGPAMADDTDMLAMLAQQQNNAASFAEDRLIWSSPDSLRCGTIFL